MDWEHKPAVRFFPYVSSSGDVLDIRAWDIIAGKMTAGDVQVKKWIKVVSVVFRPGHREALMEVADATSSVVDSCANFHTQRLIFPLSRIKLSRKTRHRT